MADPISEPTIVPISPAVAEALSERVHKASIHAPRYSGRQQGLPRRSNNTGFLLPNPGNTPSTKLVK
jgi:hypothetical protein